MTAKNEEEPPESTEASASLPEIDEGEELYLKSRESRLRQELARRLSSSCPANRGVTLLNMDSGETTCFDSYPDALSFMKGKKGRWYLTGSPASQVGNEIAAETMTDRRSTENRLSPSSSDDQSASRTENAGVAGNRQDLGLC